MQLKARFLVSFLGVSLLGIAVVAAAVYEIGEAADEGDRLYASVVLPLDDLLTLTESFQRIRINVRDLADAETPADRESAEQTIVALEQRESAAAADLGERLLTDRGRQLFKDYLGARALYADDLRHMVGAFLSGKRDEGLALLRGQGKANALKVQAILNELMEQKTQIAREEAGARHLVQGLFVALALGAVVLSALLAWVLASGISKSVLVSVRALEALAQRRWPELHDHDLHRTDEVGQLVRSVRQFAQNWAASQEAARGAVVRLRTSGLELQQMAVDTEAVAQDLRQDITAITSSVTVLSGGILRAAAGSNTALQQAELADRMVTEEAAAARALARTTQGHLAAARDRRQAPGVLEDPAALRALVASLETQLEVLDHQGQGSAVQFERLQAGTVQLLRAARAIDSEMVQLLSSSQVIERAAGNLENAAFRLTDSTVLARQAASEAHDLAVDLASVVEGGVDEPEPQGTGAA